MPFDSVNDSLKSIPGEMFSLPHMDFRRGVFIITVAILIDECEENRLKNGERRLTMAVAFEAGAVVAGRADAGVVTGVGATGATGVGVAAVGTREAKPVAGRHVLR